MEKSVGKLRKRVHAHPSTEIHGKLNRNVKNREIKNSKHIFVIEENPEHTGAFPYHFPSLSGTALTAKHESCFLAVCCIARKVTTKIIKLNKKNTTTQCHIRKINLFGASALVVVRQSAFVSVFVEMNF